MTMAREPDKPTKPGVYWYWPLPGVPESRVKVVLRQTKEQGLAVFFDGRDDYDLVDEVAGRFEPA
jgi:hypothetical protein